MNHIWSFSLPHENLGDIDNQCHWVSSGFYFMLWPEFILIAYVLEVILPFSIPHDLTLDFTISKLFMLICVQNNVTSWRLKKWCGVMFELTPILTNLTFGKPFLWNEIINGQMYFLDAKWVILSSVRTDCNFT